MKKLSILVALILCVTIGGVYAAWSYTGSTVSSADRTLSHGLATATTDGDVGIMTIVNNNVDIKIDQTAPGDYTAKLLITGAVTVNFKPNPGAPDAVKENAVNAEAVIYLKNADTNLYDGKAIYVAKEQPIALAWSDTDGDGTFTATITADQIDEILDLGGTFVLDTAADHSAFHAKEENITITLKVQQAA